MYQTFTSAEFNLVSFNSYSSQLEKLYVLITDYYNGSGSHLNLDIEIRDNIGGASHFEPKNAYSLSTAFGIHKKKYNSWKRTQIAAWNKITTRGADELHYISKLNTISQFFKNIVEGTAPEIIYDSLALEEWYLMINSILRSSSHFELIVMVHDDELKLNDNYKEQKEGEITMEDVDFKEYENEKIPFEEYDETDLLTSFKEYRKANLSNYSHNGGRKMQTRFVKKDFKIFIVPKK